MTRLIAARPTTYNGIEMRSRLEASVAQTFDSSGERWAYEPRCYASEEGQYLPDFEVFGGHARCFVEVKPLIGDPCREQVVEQFARMAVIRSSIPDAIFVVIFATFDESRIFWQLPSGFMAEDIGDDMVEYE